MCPFVLFLPVHACVHASLPSPPLNCWDAKYYERHKWPWYATLQRCRKHSIDLTCELLSFASADPAQAWCTYSLLPLRTTLNTNQPPFIYLNYQLCLFKCRQPLMSLMWSLKGTFAQQTCVTMPVPTPPSKRTSNLQSLWWWTFRLLRGISKSSLQRKSRGNLAKVVLRGEERFYLTLR